MKEKRKATKRKMGAKRRLKSGSVVAPQKTKPAANGISVLRKLHVIIGRIT